MAEAEQINRYLPTQTIKINVMAEITEQETPTVTQPDYVDKTYTVMQVAYGKAFTLDDKTFRNKVQTDPTYANKVYQVMQHEYGDKFTLDTKAFNSKIGLQLQKPQQVGQPVTQQQSVTQQQPVTDHQKSTTTPLTDWAKKQGISDEQLRTVAQKTPEEISKGFGIDISTATKLKNEYKAETTTAEQINLPTATIKAQSVPQGEGITFASQIQPKKPETPFIIQKSNDPTAADLEDITYKKLQDKDYVGAQGAAAYLAKINPSSSYPQMVDAHINYEQGNYPEAAKNYNDLLNNSQTSQYALTQGDKAIWANLQSGDDIQALKIAHTIQQNVVPEDRKTTATGLLGTEMPTEDVELFASRNLHKLQDLAYSYQAQAYIYNKLGATDKANAALAKKKQYDGRIDQVKTDVYNQRVLQDISGKTEVAPLYQFNGDPVITDQDQDVYLPDGTVKHVKTGEQMWGAKISANLVDALQGGEGLPLGVAPLLNPVGVVMHGMTTGMESGMQTAIKGGKELGLGLAEGVGSAIGVNESENSISGFLNEQTIQGLKDLAMGGMEFGFSASPKLQSIFKVQIPIGAMMVNSIESGIKNDPIYMGEKGSGTQMSNALMAAYMQPVSSLLYKTGLVNEDNLNPSVKNLVSMMDVAGMVFMTAIGSKIGKGINDGSITADANTPVPKSVIDYVTKNDKMYLDVLEKSRNGLPLTKADIQIFTKGLEDKLSDPQTVQTVKSFIDDGQQTLDNTIIQPDPKQEPIDKEANIAFNQQKHNLPTTPEVRINDDTALTLDKISRNEPVTNEFVKSAADNLKSEYDRLEASKQATNRTYTIEQINDAKRNISEQITMLDKMEVDQQASKRFSIKATPESSLEIVKMGEVGDIPELINNVKENISDEPIGHAESPSVEKPEEVKPNEGGTLPETVAPEEANEAAEQKPSYQEHEPDNADKARDFAIDAVKEGIVDTYKPKEKFNKKGYNGKHTVTNNRINLDRMSNVSKIKGIKDIEKGNYDTAPAKRLISHLSVMYKEGGIKFLEGNGGTIRRTRVDIHKAFDVINESKAEKANEAAELTHYEAVKAEDMNNPEFNEVYEQLEKHKADGNTNNGTINAINERTADEANKLAESISALDDKTKSAESKSSIASELSHEAKQQAITEADKVIEDADKAIKDATIKGKKGKTVETHEAEKPKENPTEVNPEGEKGKLTDEQLKEQIKNELREARKKELIDNDEIKDNPCPTKIGRIGDRLATL